MLITCGSRSRLVALIVVGLLVCLASAAARADVPRPKPNPDPNPAPVQPDEAQSQQLVVTTGRPITRASFTTLGLVSARVGRTMHHARLSASAVSSRVTKSKNPDEANPTPNRSNLSPTEARAQAWLALLTIKGLAGHDTLLM